MILSAALLVQFRNCPYPTIIPCWRHATGYEILADVGKEYYKIDEGFILSENGAFLNRYDAYDYAVKNHQISLTTKLYKEDKGEKELYSEDLY